MAVEIPEQNFAMDLVRVTEAAAMSAARWLGKGDRESSDGAAVDAMRTTFNALSIQGTVVIGEGEKDRAPMLFNGESLGSGSGPAVDVAVDPVEGTSLLAYGRPNAISVVGVAPAGSMFRPGPSWYMQKLVAPQEARDVVDLDAPVSRNLERVAKALEKDVDDLVVFVLDKPRHQRLIQAIREAGARIQLHSDGDVAGSLMVVSPNAEVDLMLGTGGTPEGVITACALHGTGGCMLARLDPQTPEERQAILDAGVDPNAMLTEKDLVASEDSFFACTGISSGSLLQGVKFTGKGAVTHSLVIRGKTGTVRFIESHHDWSRLMRISALPYD